MSTFACEHLMCCAGLRKRQDGSDTRHKRLGIKHFGKPGQVCCSHVDNEENRAGLVLLRALGFRYRQDDDAARLTSGIRYPCVAPPTDTKKLKDWDKVSTVGRSPRSRAAAPRMSRVR